MGTFPPSCALNFKYEIQQKFHLPKYNSHSPVQNLVSCLTAYNLHKELTSKLYWHLQLHEQPLIFAQKILYSGKQISILRKKIF